MKSKNFSRIKEDFDIPNAVYLDSATKTYCPKPVIDTLSQISNQYDFLDSYELVRHKVSSLINAKKESEIVFTYSNTHSLNIIAQGICHTWKPKDCIIVPESEHYANLNIWRTLSVHYGFRFETVNVIKDGSLDLGHLEDILEDCDGKILFSISHISNTIGYVQPIKELFAKVKEYDGITVLDASLSISREHIDVQDMEVDLLTFGSNTFFGPTGTGVLYGKHKILEKLNPLIWDNSSDQIPWKLESTVPNIGVVALGSAIDWFKQYDLEDFKCHNRLLNAVTLTALNDLDFVEIFHPGFYKGGLISFNVKGKYPKDVEAFLKKNNIIVNSGFLDAQMIVEEKFVNGVVRASWSCYTTNDDIQLLKSTLIQCYDAR